MMKRYTVEVIVDIEQCMRNCSRLLDGRFRFLERIVTNSAKDALEYFKHYRITPPAPLTLELKVIYEEDYPDGGNVITLTGPRYRSGLANSPFADAMTRFGMDGRIFQDGKSSALEVDD